MDQSIETVPDDCAFQRVNRVAIVIRHRTIWIVSLQSQTTQEKLSVDGGTLLDVSPQWLS